MSAEKPCLYFVDDEQDLRLAHEQTLKLAGYRVRLFGDAETALAALEQELPDTVITDMQLPGMSGMDLLGRLRRIDEDLPVILITGHGDISLAVQAIQEGAYDFIEKPFSSDRLVDTVRRALDKRQLTLEVRQLKRELESQEALGPRLIGRTPAMRALRAAIGQLADTNADILVLGETGTGKEMVARSLHEQSSRRDKHFVAVNCGAIPEHLIESELFGHEKGAFTGAEARRIGKFEHAQGGTLFLDEIESMPLPAQVRLLRVLQDRCVERVGSNDPVALDIRVVAATKVNLKEASAAGAFREDLYYRLNVVTLELPPLRERREDIVRLFQHFLLLASARYGREAPAPAPERLRALQAHSWPGNVRELRNAAERYVLLGDSCGFELAESDGGCAPMTLPEQVELFERSVIEQALDDAGGSIKRTMDRLGLPRKTLYDKMRKYGLDKSQFK